MADHMRYQRIEIVVERAPGKSVLSQQIVREAVQAAGYKIAWSGTSAACGTCAGRGYVNVRPIHPDAPCLATSDDCPDCEQLCYCDMDDTFLDAPDHCFHDCEPEDDDRWYDPDDECIGEPVSAPADTTEAQQ